MEGFCPLIPKWTGMEMGFYRPFSLAYCRMWLIPPHYNYQQGVNEGYYLYINCLFSSRVNLRLSKLKCNS